MNGKYSRNSEYLFYLLLHGYWCRYCLSVRRGRPAEETCYAVMPGPNNVMCAVGILQLTAYHQNHIHIFLSLLCQCSGQERQIDINV